MLEEEREVAKERRAHGETAPGKPKSAYASGNDSRSVDGDTGRARDKAGEAVGVSGRLVADAEKLKRADPERAHGRWTDWIEERLPISEATVRKLMTIGRGLAKRSNSNVLPPAQRTLYDLACLDEDEWEAVRPKLSRPDIAF